MNSFLLGLQMLKHRWKRSKNHLTGKRKVKKIVLNIERIGEHGFLFPNITNIFIIMTVICNFLFY